ncbi:MAG: bifunctional phosphoribosyl-AMP cyclohydrolase/phosphoribosyl-ATP diphosphatase HisIE, partial [Nitrospirae bacterium]|nr:bifunctional phosphoribosyl-AMP cyclohydrolase/phosphoribosyl-ATP diphosphatase HisIE [Nitrospirota bacterium]
ANGLIPAVIQDDGTRQVLMVAWMNAESLAETLETGLTHFWSRSRKKLWQKGETSGHIQRVKRIFYDCDADTLLIQVDQTGPACHTGNPACFFQEAPDLFPAVKSGEPETGSAPDPLILEKVYRVIQDRKAHPREDSYVHKLFTGGQDRILKKIGEEAGELVIGSKNNREEEIIYEMADLWFHSLVLLGYHGIPLEGLYQELERRFGKSGLREEKK